MQLRQQHEQTTLDTALCFDRESKILMTANPVVIPQIIYSFLTGELESRWTSECGERWVPELRLTTATTNLSDAKGHFMRLFTAHASCCANSTPTEIQSESLGEEPRRGTRSGSLSRVLVSLRRPSVPPDACHPSAI